MRFSQLLALRKESMIRSYSIVESPIRRLIVYMYFDDIVNTDHFSKRNLELLVKHQERTYPSEWNDTNGPGSYYRIPPRPMGQFENVSMLDLEKATLGEFVRFMVQTDCPVPWMNQKYACDTMRVKRLLEILLDAEFEKFNGSTTDHLFHRKFFNIRLLDLSSNIDIGTIENQSVFQEALTVIADFVLNQNDASRKSR